MSLIENRPSLSISEATELFVETYGQAVQAIEPLVGERDQNFLVTTAAACSFVLKVCNEHESRNLLLAQNAAMELLSSFAFVPQPLRTRTGESLGAYSTAGRTFAIRAVEYLPGTPLALLKCPPRYLLEDLGRKLGQLDRGLSEFDDVALRRKFSWNLMCGVDVVRENQELISDPTTRQNVQQCLDRFARRLAERESQLRRTVIHNDANDYNVIISSDRNKLGEHVIGGIIDFGDMAYSYIVAEVAVASAYVVCRRKDWLNAACELVRGYNRSYPLESIEVECLFDLMLLRLCTSLCMSAKQQRERPNDEYLSVSQTPIQNALPQLLKIDPRLVECRLRDACGPESPSAPRN